MFLKRFRAQMMAYASFSIMAQPNCEPDSFWLANLPIMHLSQGRGDRRTAGISMHDVRAPDVRQNQRRGRA